MVGGVLCERHIWLLCLHRKQLLLLPRQQSLLRCIGVHNFIAAIFHHLLPSTSLLRLTSIAESKALATTNTPNTDIILKEVLALVMPFEPYTMILNTPS